MAILNNSTVNGMLTVNGTLNLQSTDGNEIYNVASEIEKFPRKVSVEQYISDTISTYTNWNYLCDHSGSQPIIKQLPKNIMDYNEFMLCLHVWFGGGDVDQGSRVLNSIIIPVNAVGVGETYHHWYDPGMGQHQVYYSETYRGGVTFYGESKVKLYANDTSWIRLFAR